MMKTVQRLKPALVVSLVAACLTVSVTSQAKTCGGKKVKSSPTSSVPGEVSKFSGALSNVARVQYPEASNTCLSGGDVRSKFIDSRWYISNNNLVFNVPANTQRLELRGNTFSSTSGSDRTLRMKIKVKDINKSDHSDRFTVGQLFAENYSEDAAKLTISDGRLEINYNDGKSKKDLGAAPRASFKEITLTLKRRKTSTTYEALSVKYDGKTTKVRLSSKYYNSTSDKVYFKAGCYLQDRSGRCRVDISSLRLDD